MMKELLVQQSHKQWLPSEKPQQICAEIFNVLKLICSYVICNEQTQAAKTWIISECSTKDILIWFTRTSWHDSSCQLLQYVIKNYFQKKETYRKWTNSTQFKMKLYSNFYKWLKNLWTVQIWKTLCKREGQNQNKLSKPFGTIYLHIFAFEQSKFLAIIDHPQSNGMFPFNLSGISWPFKSVSKIPIRMKMIVQSILLQNQNY